MVVGPLLVAGLGLFASMAESGPTGAPADFRYPRTGLPTSPAARPAAPSTGATSAGATGPPRTVTAADPDRRYDTCAQAVAAGLGPYKVGRDAEYAWYPDDDRDGWACERNPDRPARAVHYRTCAQARAAGAAPLRRGEPGYSRRLDRDGDGIACD